MAKNAPSGIYHITAVFDIIYKSQFQVAQYIVPTEDFNVTSIKDTLTINEIEVHDALDNDVNLSSSSQSLTSIHESNFSEPFTLLTEGFKSEFCVDATNNIDENIILYLDSLILENPTLGENKILVSESNEETAEIEKSSTEEICFSNNLPLDLTTHSDYRFVYEFRIGDVNERFTCGDECDFTGTSDFFYVAEIEDMIDIPKFITSPSASDKGRPAVFIMNEKNEKLYMFDDYNYTSQENIDWGNSSVVCVDKDDGTEKTCDLSVYATAGKKIRTCFEARSYFREEVFISISEVSIDRDVDESATVLSREVFETTVKSVTDSDMFLSQAVSRALEGDGNLTDGRNFFCSDFMTIPDFVFGGNDWDIQMEFRINNEFYDLDEEILWIVESDEFPIFGKIESQPDWGLHLFSPVHYNIPESDPEKLLQEILN